MGAYLRLTLVETLDGPGGAGPGVNPMARTVRTAWCSLPGDWVVEGRPPPFLRRALVDRLSGRAGPAGGPTGGLTVLTVQATVLSDGEARARPWLGDRAAFYVCDPDGSLREARPGEL